MKKTYADGWHTISGYDCYVESGGVKRGIVGDGADRHTAYPYRWDKRLKCWSNAAGVAPGTLRAGLARGTYSMR